MNIEAQQTNGRHEFGYTKERYLTPLNMMPQQQFSILNIIAERDAAIEERNQAFFERKKVFEERQVAIAQRNIAITECNDAVLERNNAFAALEQSLNAPIGFGRQHPVKRLVFNPGNFMEPSPGYPKSDMEILDALRKTMVSSECSESTPQTKTRKGKRKVNDMNKKVFPVPDNLRLMNNWNAHKAQDLGLNRIDFDKSFMPVPGCTCTGTLRQCYKWGNGGWQSCCCTTTISAFPLPAVPNKRYGRMGGRKMTGSAFSKLLSRLAMEGFDLSRPVDLKEHWSKHGTNRYITIK